MSAIPMLEEDECYLWGILDDPSGIELAEFCVSKDTLVLTRRGHVAIQEVLVGDEVLTHRGRWRKVSAVLDRGVKPVVTLKGVGVPGLTVTADHRLYARKARQGLRSVEGHRDVFLLNPDWLEAGELEFGGSGRVRNTRYATPAVVPPSGESCSPEMAWLLGRWLADGSKAYSKQLGYAIDWAIRDRDLADFKLRLKAAGFDRATVSATRSTQCWSVRVYRKQTWHWLPKGRAEDKVVPTWVLGADEAVRQAVLDGYLSGDGFWSGSNWQAATVSPRLAADLRVLAATLGWSVSMTVTPAKPRQVFGTTVQAQELWSLTMTDDGGWTQTDQPHQWSMWKSREEAGEAHVYDLSVEEDHSFVAAGVVVHNCWVDEEREDGCFRLWDFQWPWYRAMQTFQIDYAGRSLGKSIGIQMRAFAFPFNYPGMEMLITAPQLNHLRPVTDKIEHQILSHRLSKEMLPKQRGNGINHQPQFQAHFANNSRLVSRLPQESGLGVKGMHPLVIEADEMQDFPDNGWVELIETMKHYSVGAQWRCHGVSRGVRDRYYRYTMGMDPDLPFYVHRYMAMHRPSWGAEERKAKIAIYGGTDDNVDYRRNIYGEHGDATNPIFVLARLMQCVRQNESPWATEYNTSVFQCIRVNDELLRRADAPIQNLIDLSSVHLDERYTSFWAGADIGFTRDPTEILVFGELEGKKKGDESTLRLLLRLHLMRISADDQADAVRHIFEHYGERLRCFAMDKTGNGLPLWQGLDPEAVGTSMHLRRTPEHIASRVKGYNFSSRVAVEFDDRELEKKEKPTDAVIEKNIIDFATDELRKLVDQYRLELPYDRELLTEFQGQEVQYVRDEGSASGTRRAYKGGTFHTLDASKMMIAGRNLQLIESILKAKPRRGPVLDRFGV